MEAEGLLGLGILCLSAGDLKSATRHLDLSKALFSATCRNNLDVVRAILPLAAVCRLDGDRVTGRALLLKARSLSLALEDPVMLGAVSLNLGTNYIESGDLAEATKCYDFVARSASLLELREREVRGRLGLALASLRSGRTDEGLGQAREALALATELGLTLEIAEGLEYLGGLESQKQNSPSALSNFAHALRQARRNRISPESLLEIHRWIAEFWIGLGSTKYASIHLRRAQTHSTTVTEAEDSLALDRIEAEVLWLEGNAAEALEALLAHARIAADKGFGYEHLLTARRIAMVAADANEEALAEEWWARTEFLADSCGALALLERWREEWDRVRPAHQTGTPQPLDSTGPEDSTVDTAPPDDELPWVDLERYGIITRSRKLEEQASWIARLAPTKVPVLISGQSGTGKELYAHLVHLLSPRQDHAFLAINCGALPAEIIESELFGHRRGAFTGAIADKPGLFREAHRGTLFLDEIGEMPAPAQSKLLRVLETGEVRPVGGIRYETVDVRIVAATNVNLEKAVHESRFRKDLYYRLKGLEVVLPPLRERLADIPPLAQHFLRHSSGTQKKDLKLPFDTIQWLMGQPWPGNVRELKLAMERAVAMAPASGLVLPRHFIGIQPADEISSLPEELEEIERARVENALEANNWNTAAAARLLGMSRTTLSGRMKKLGVRKPRRR